MPTRVLLGEEARAQKDVGVWWPIDGSGGAFCFAHDGGRSDIGGTGTELQHASVVWRMPEHDFLSLVCRPAVPRRGQPTWVSEGGLRVSLLGGSGVVFATSVEIGNGLVYV